MIKRTLQGIGLLELMLSLAIIAILLIMATRYYQSAHQNQLVSQGVDMFGAVQAAVQTYRLDNTDLSAVSISTLVSKGYLPNSYGSGGAANPWGGLLTVTPNTGTGVLVVEMTGVPGGSDDTLAKRLNDTISKTGSGSYGACGGKTATCGTGCTAGDNKVCAAYPL